jgi:hypothetical protein
MASHLFNKVEVKGVRWIEEPGRSLIVDVANRPFKLIGVDHRGDTIPDEILTESGTFQMWDSKPWKKLGIVNIDPNDTLTVLIRASMNIVGSGANKVPPTYTNPFGKFTLAAVGDKSSAFGGIDDYGRRRMKVRIQMCGTINVNNRVGVYKGPDADADADMIGEISYYNQVFSEPIDCKIRLKLLNGAACELVGMEANHLSET